MIPSETQIGWQDYLAIIVRRRWFFLIPCVLIVTVSLVVGMFLPRIYHAETVLLIQDEKVINPLIEGLAVATPVAERLRTLREEILGWTSLSRLANELKLDKQAKSPLAFERLIKRLQSDIDVRMRGRDLVTVSYEDRDPVLAQSLVNTITNIYLQRNVESQNAEAGTAISFIESEMAGYKKKLEDSERSLREFKELYVTQMPVANQINDQIVDLEVSLAKMLIEDTEDHPEVIETRRRIADLKQRRNNEIRRVITTALTKGTDPTIYQDLAKALDTPLTEEEAKNPTIRTAKEAYQAWVAHLDSTTTKGDNAAPTQKVQIVTVPTGENATTPPGVIDGAASASISLGPREEQELARLTRDYDVYSQTYKSMQERLERAKVTQRLGESDEGTKFKILEPARLPLKPIRPNMAKIFFFALLLGAFVGAGIAFVAEYLDQSFQSAEDVQGMLELPVLASISTIITEADITARNSRRKSWVSIREHRERFKTYVASPIWARLDRVLVRWGL